MAQERAKNRAPRGYGRDETGKICLSDSLKLDFAMLFDMEHFEDVLTRA